MFVKKVDCPACHGTKSHNTGHRVSELCPLTHAARKTNTNANRAVNKARYAGYLRRSTLKARFGITPEQYETLLKSQGGVCAVCKGVNKNGRKLAVDHDHQTKHIRGLLCGRCNHELGLLGDSITGVELALVYLLDAASRLQNT